MIGVGVLFLCLLAALRLLWTAARHRGLTAFCAVVGVVAIESFARAEAPATRADPARPAPETIAACQNANTALKACAALISGNDEALKAWALNQRGIAHAMKGAALDAIADFTKAIELMPEDATAWSNRGTVYARLGDLLPALSDHQRALDLAPEKASAWHNRGVDHEEMGEHKKALADYAKAIDLDPGHIGSHVGLATANCKLGRVKASAAARLALIDKGLMKAIALQQILKDEGFYKGPLDGKFGKGSRSALRAWTRKGCLAHA